MYSSNGFCTYLVMWKAFPPACVTLDDMQHGLLQGGLAAGLWGARGGGAGGGGGRHLAPLLSNSTWKQRCGKVRGAWCKGFHQQEVRCSVTLCLHV